MLSILIPTYNYCCYPLIKELNNQAKILNIPSEIIVADDASQEKFKIENREINSLPHSTYIELPENMGRARIRNFLANQAKGDWLLFMDCDAQVISTDFLKAYISFTHCASVVCGGLLHPKVQPSPDVSLRYLYEKEADKNRSAASRSKHPYECFTTFCFLIKRTVFLKIQFDESCYEYGYEDTLFGEELKNNNIDILHIDNPLMHIGLEANAVFLNKTKIALQSMLRLQNRGMCFHSRLMDKYNLLNRFRLTFLFIILFRFTAPALKRNLLSPKPNLTFFALYKLGYYAYLKKHYTHKNQSNE